MKTLPCLGAGRQGKATEDNITSSDWGRPASNNGSDKAPALAHGTPGWESQVPARICRISQHRPSHPIPSPSQPAP